MAIPSPLENESEAAHREVNKKKINKSVRASKLITSMNHNGFVIENDENIAYDKSSAQMYEDVKKEEQIKLTSVTYDSLGTPGAPNVADVALVQK